MDTHTNTHAIKKQLSAAYRYSYSRMALNYYAFYETMCEETALPTGMEGYAKEFHGILKEFLGGNPQPERLDSLRGRVTAEMEILTAYTDCFQIYEYVLNRMERKFSDGVRIEGDIAGFTAQLMEYLMSSKDSVIMNERIGRVIGQLPVRYTRQKFYQLLMDGMSVYIGSEKKSLDNMLYVLRTESMAELPEEMERGRGDLYEILGQLRTADYLHMEKEEYQKNIDRIVLVSDKLYGEAGDYMLLQDLINDLYVLLLSEPAAMIDLSERQTLEDVVTGVLNQFLEGNTSMIDDAVTELLYELEGKQESAMERYLSYPACDEASLEPMAVTARKVERLLSGSSFAPLAEEDDADSKETVDRPWLEQKMDAFYKELDLVFAGTSKPVVRAIMARLLSALPMLFNTAGELEAYITKSLESCSDLAERETSMELLNQEMVDEDALV